MAVPTSQELEELGLTAAAKTVTEQKELTRKMAIAYEHFDYITPEMVKSFCDQLRKKTEHEDKYHRMYDTLRFIALEQYTDVPPAEALQALRAAKEKRCFDYFEIAKIESTIEQKDPIMFGKITGCQDSFVVCSWDDDVTVEAIKASLPQ